MTINLLFNNSLSLLSLFLCGVSNKAPWVCMARYWSKQQDKEDSRRTEVYQSSGHSRPVLLQYRWCKINTQLETHTIPGGVHILICCATGSYEGWCPHIRQTHVVLWAKRHRANVEPNNRSHWWLHQVSHVTITWHHETLCPALQCRASRRNNICFPNEVRALIIHSRACVVNNNISVAMMSLSTAVANWMNWRTIPSWWGEVAPSGTRSQRSYSGGTMPEINYRFVSRLTRVTQDANLVARIA